jgi:hypothetical protein
LSLKQDQDLFDNDAAARWLRENEKQIDPHDPHDQLPGVDLTRPPWE